MTTRQKLSCIKLIHTAIWAFYNVVIFYLLYAVIADQISIWVWVGFAFIVGEVLILIIFKKICPITLLARKYSDSTKDNFDIYLPEWLARYNKLIYSAIVIITVGILISRLSSS